MLTNKFNSGIILLYLKLKVNSDRTFKGRMEMNPAQIMVIVLDIVCLISGISLIIQGFRLAGGFWYGIQKAFFMLLATAQISGGLAIFGLGYILTKLFFHL